LRPCAHGERPQRCCAPEGVACSFERTTQHRPVSARVLREGKDGGEGEGKGGGGGEETRVEMLRQMPSNRSRAGGAPIRREMATTLPQSRHLCVLTASDRYGKYRERDLDGPKRARESPQATGGSHRITDPAGLRQAGGVAQGRRGARGRRRRGAGAQVAKGPPHTHLIGCCSYAWRACRVQGDGSCTCETHELR